MPDLGTSYMGIELKNPIILGACNLSEDVDTIKVLEDEGIAAVVFKSLFEEQIILEKIQLNEAIDEYADRNAEMVTVFPSIKHGGSKEHLFKIKKLRNSIKIPIIASLNCINNKIWVDYAKQLEETGIDGLELNFYTIHPGSRQRSSDFEKNMIETTAMVVSNVTIPVSIKMNYFYTNIFEVVMNLENSDVKGFVFFNRLFTPDINVENLDYFYPIALSSSNENKIPLRFTGMLSGKINSDICTSSGIYEPQDIIKMLLSGASCIQTVSSVYKNKFKNIPALLKGIEVWMNKNNFKYIRDFKGLLSKDNLKDPFFFEREQYIDILNNNETIIKKEFKI